MTDLIRASVALPAQAVPRGDWPAEARALREELLAVYGEHDGLPDVAGGWLARWPSVHTRRAYARGFRVWEGYVRGRGGHPLTVAFPLADAFARHLETAPTRRRVKGGRSGELAPTGKPRTPASRANVLSACSSFYTYAVRARAAAADPFEAVLRPPVDPDESPTAGLTEEETATLIAAAAAWSPRAEALVLLLYLMGPRVDELLALDADQLGYDRGHRTLPLRVKGGKVRAKPVTPLALDALQRYLDGRTDGPLFTTRTGARLRQPEVWKLLRRLAKKAGLPQADTIKLHALRHGFITDALDAGVPLPEVQDAVNHKDRAPPSATTGAAATRPPGTPWPDASPPAWRPPNRRARRRKPPEVVGARALRRQPQQRAPRSPPGGSRRPQHRLCHGLRYY